MTNDNNEALEILGRIAENVGGLIGELFWHREVIRTRSPLSEADKLNIKVIERTIATLEPLYRDVQEKRGSIRPN